MTTAQSQYKPIFMREETGPTLSPALESAAPKAGPLFEIRSAAFSALQSMGLPNSDSEAFTFLRVGEILPHFGPPSQAAQDAQDAQNGNASSAITTDRSANPITKDFIQTLIFPESAESYAVVVDGIFIPTLSNPGPDFHLKALEGEYRDSLTSLIAEETDAAAALAMVFSAQPLLIDIAPKTIPRSPLQILHIRTDKPCPLEVTVLAKPGCRNDSFLIVHAGKLSESRILIRHIHLSDADVEGMINVHTIAILDEAANLNILESGAGSETASGIESDSRTIHFRKLTGRLERNSRLTAFTANTGSRLLRNSFNLDLAGEGADAEINGATVLTGNRQAHSFVRIRHLVPNCTSRQHFKSVAADISRSSVDGTIYVAKDAQGTNANQRINNLMLSDEARTDSKPQLLIHADDVKCAHGATIGKLDPTQQFYLESRGLSPIQARTLLTVAFIAEILDKARPSGSAASGKKGNQDASGFNATLEHALLDTLKLKLPAEKGQDHVRKA